MQKSSGSLSELCSSPRTSISIAGSSYFLEHLEGLHLHFPGIYIDICNTANIMLLGKGSSLAVGHGRGFISIIKLSARVESLGTALASTTFQAKPACRGNKFLNVYS